MATELFRSQADAVRRVFASVTASDADACSRPGVTITARPEPAPWPFTAMTIGCGTGLVVCVEGSYVEWAREHASSDVQRAQYIAAPLTAEGARRGEDLHPMPPMLGWALSSRPLPPQPTGYRLERVDKAWMDQW